MNNISYNLKRHIELLNHQKIIESRNESFLVENEAEFLELLDYNAAVDSHIFWETRYEVSSLLQAFLNKEIDANEFHDSVFGLRRNHIAKCDKFLSRLGSEEIKEFSPNKESYKLEGFLSALYFQCENFEMDWDEEEFYTSIRNGFLKFQRILNEE